MDLSRDVIFVLFVQGQWLECIADNYGQVHGRSEREWNLVLDEWREHQRQQSKKRVSVNGPLVAHFLEENVTEERVLLQHQHDLEAQPIRETLMGKNVTDTRMSEPKTIVELDLTMIPCYEEYR